MTSGFRFEDTYSELLFEEEAGSFVLDDIATTVVPTPVYSVDWKSTSSWADRIGITVPDVIAPISTDSFVISETMTFGKLVITADGPVDSTVIGIAIVLWDERGNPISVNSGNITLSGWLTNSDGNFIASNAFGLDPPGSLFIDVSLASGYTALVQSIVPSGSPINIHCKLI